MSGTIRGTLDAYTNESTEFKDVANIFKTWFDAFEAHPNMTRIALQYGSGGTGTDYWDGASPFGRNAFVVWRMETSAARAWPYYIIMQVNSDGVGGATFGAAPGDPATNGVSTSSNNGILCLGMAIGIGGDLDPWNGSTNNDGTDSKGGSAAFPLGNDGLGRVWRIPAGGTGLLMIPRSNNFGGDQVATAREQMNVYNAGSPAQSRYHLVMDDDNLWISADITDEGTSRHIMMGLIDTHAGLTVDYPFVAFSYTDPVQTSTIGQGEGGGFIPDSTDPTPVRNVDLDTIDALSTNPQPNRLLSPAEYDLLPLWVRLNEAPINGLLGTFGIASDDFFLFCYDVADRATNPGKTRAVIGHITRANLKACMPWDGLTVPGLNFTREGITF